jgi:hypothetical protein
MKPNVFTFTVESVYAIVDVVLAYRSTTVETEAVFKRIDASTLAFTGSASVPVARLFALLPNHHTTNP